MLNIKKVIYPNTSFVSFIFYVFYNLIFFSLLRLLFFIRNFEFFKNISWREVFLSFLSGIRFDLSSITVSVSIFFLLLILPFVNKFKFWKYYKKTVIFLIFLIMNLSYVVLIIDIFYYVHAARRLSAVEILSLPTHFQEMSKVVLMNYLWAVIIFLGFFAILNFLLVRILKIIERKTQEGSIGNRIIYFLVFVVIATIFIRGGLQDRPLRPAFAFDKGNVQLGHLSLNGVYTVLHSIWETKVKIKEEDLIEYETAKKILQNLIKVQNEKFLDNNYPVVREISYETRPLKLNIVIFIMENWSPWASEIYDGKFDNIIPNFDRIAKQGLVFKNFYSCANRTWPSIAAILFSIPPVFMVSIADEPFNQNTYRSVAHILKELGYTTLFIHGGRRSTFSFDLATRYLGGFDRCIFLEDFDLSKVRVDKSWSVHDEYVFLRANEEFKKIKEPFLGVVLGLTPHEPYDIPEEFKIFSSTIPESGYFNALRYSDYGLGRFFEVAQKEEYFYNTLFIIVADHQNPVYADNMFDAHRIICMFYAPKYIKPAIYTAPASHLDIVPSIIDFLKISTIHSSFGSSVFARKENRVVFCTRNEIFYWVKNDKVLVHNLDKVLGFYDYIVDPKCANNLICSYDCMELEKEFLSFYTVARKVLMKNLIYHVKFDKKQKV